MTTEAQAKSHSPPISCDSSMPTGGRRTMSRSDNLSARQSAAANAAVARSTSSRACSTLGTTPGLNLIRASELADPSARPRPHLHRRPSHRAAAVARLPRGTYSAVYPAITQDEEGMRRLFRQFSFPASRALRRDSGSIHEAASSAIAVARFRRRLRQSPPHRRLHRWRRRSGTGPAATGWHGNKFSTRRATAACRRSCI